MLRPGCSLAQSRRLMSSDHCPEDHSETDALVYILLSQGRAFCLIGEKIVKMWDLDDRGKYPECHFTQLVTSVEGFQAETRDVIEQSWVTFCPVIRQSYYLTMQTLVKRIGWIFQH